MRRGPHRNYPVTSIALAFWLASALTLYAQEQPAAGVAHNSEPSLVRVNIISETRLPGNFELYGKRIPDYQPKIIQVFPSTGIVIDDKGHVLTFLGYRWVDIQSPDPRIDIITSEGQKYRGKLVGIDQSMGVAVVVCPNSALPRTPVCKQCEIRDGTTVVTPVAESGDFPQFRDAQILSVTNVDPQSSWGSQFLLTFNRVPGVGEPILNADHDVLGFVSSQNSMEDPLGARVVFYPISQLLTSAERILQAGGHIRTGWLGVFLVTDAARPTPERGVVVKAVQQGSPAEKAGLAPEDIIVKWRGTEIRDERQFIQLVQETPIGSTADIALLRQGKPLTASALIEARKPQEAAQRLAFRIPEVIPFSAAQPVDAPFLGISMAPLTPQLAEAMQMPGQTGLLVLAVDPQTPFGRAGVLEGDVIVAANGYRIRDTHALLQHARIRRIPVILKILRKGIERSLVVK